MRRLKWWIGWRREGVGGGENRTKIDEIFKPPAFASLNEKVSQSFFFPHIYFDMTIITYYVYIRSMIAESNNLTKRSSSYWLVILGNTSINFQWEWGKGWRGKTSLSIRTTFSFLLLLDI